MYFLFPILSLGQIAAMFKIGNSKELPAIPENLSEEGKDFIRQCLQREPAKRPTAVELLQHPFVKAAASVEKYTNISDPLVDRQAVAPSFSIPKVQLSRKSKLALNLYIFFLSTVGMF
jgi:serine/threonine protein kinase